MRAWKSLWILAMMWSLWMLAACGSSSPASETSSNAGNDGRSNGQAEQNTQPQMFTLLTTDSSSSYYSYFVGVANAITSAYPEIQINVTETGGATDNMQRLLNKEAVFSLGVSVSDYKSYNGMEPYEENKDIRVLWYFAPSPFNVIVNKESGVQNLEDLTGKDFSIGGAGTSTEQSMLEIINTLGIEPNIYNGSLTDAQEAFSNRQIVGLVKAGMPPDSYVQQVAAVMDIDILSFTDEQRQKIEAELPYYTFTTIPANSYDGVDHDAVVPQFALGALLDKSVPQEIGYKMWKAMWSENGKLIWGSAYAAGQDVDVPRLTVETARIPLHAGAVQFLKELGVEVPEELIPPEYTQN